MALILASIRSVDRVRGGQVEHGLVAAGVHPTVYIVPHCPIQNCHTIM